MNIYHLPNVRFIFTVVVVILLLTGLTPTFAQSGNCTNETPFFSVDLRGQPGGSFTTPNINRDGNCCGSAVNTNCVEFEIFLDPRASGLAFDITAGPEPAGAMFYEINCGTPISVGDSTCADGTGPQLLTICMPGNAKNQFTIYSVVAFEETADISVTEGCSGTITAPIAFDPTSVTYNDITGGGTYNSYLSCLSGCSETTVTPDASAPSFVDYVVCGNSNNSNCTATPFCDTVRVNFYPRIQVSVDPSPALICQNGNTTLQGQVSGGSGGPYTYIWYDAADGAGNVVGNTINYLATAAGTYSFEVRNENYPNCEPFISNVEINDNFSISAGVDQTVCQEAIIQLNGSVQGASGGIWSGGSGLFSPDNQTLNATYTPTQTEITAGTLTLTLTSTGNGNCTAGTAATTITFYQSMSVTLDGPPTLCNNNTSTIQAAVNGGSGNYGYLWSTGETTSSVTKPAGAYSVTVTDVTRGCQSGASITITQLNGPTAIRTSSNNASCGNANGSINVAAVIGGSAPYSYSLDDITYQSSATFSGLLPNTYTVYAQDANGCKVNIAANVADAPGPSDIQVSTNNASCGNTDGSITVNGATGGTAPFEYSIDGINFQGSAFFTGLAADNYSIYIRDANSCLYDETATIVNLGGPDGASISTTIASCSDNDGSITVNSVSNGTGPYQYSIDGTSYQSSSSFTGLASGTYTVYIRDANNCIYTQDEIVPSEAPTAVAASTTSATCSQANGTITIQNITGGLAPFTYSTDGVQFQSTTSFTSLLPGSYTITARDDNGCIITTDLQVSDIPGPGTLQFQSQSSTCGASNGALSITGTTGGTTPYQYSIDGVNFQASTDFNNLAAGTYDLTVKDANNCTFTISGAVNDINGPTSLNIASSPSSCGDSNGLITVNGVVGGSSPYQYAVDGGSFQLSNIFNAILAGAHTISAKDANGCIISSNVTVGDVAGPSNFTSTTTSATCGASDGSIDITGVTDGLAPYQYALDNGSFQTGTSFSGLSAATYQITVRDMNDCEFIKSVNVINNGGPNAITYVTTAANCGQSDGTITINSVTAGDAPYSYSIDGASFQSSNQFVSLDFGSYDVTIQDNKGCTYSEVVFVLSEGPETMEVQIANTICSLDNGTIEITTVSGGTAPYMYSLDGATYQSGNSFGNLSIGDYTVYIQDNKGCLLTEDVSVIDIPGPQDLQFTLVDATCGLSNGQFITDAVIGGTVPYSYALDGSPFQSSDTFQGIAASPHSVTVRDANNCEITVSFDINNISGPSELTATSAPADCNQSNGNIVATAVIGGTAPFLYSLDGTNFQSEQLFAGLSQGLYTLVARDDNGCEVSTTVDVLNNDGPQSITPTIVNEICGSSDGSINVTTVGGGLSPYIYAIDDNNFQNSPDFTGLMAATYIIYVKDANDCIYQQQVTVGSNGPTAVNYSGTAASCDIADGTISIDQVVGGSSPYSYSIDGINFQNTNTFTNLGAGTYTLTIVDANTCTYTQSVAVNGQGPVANLDQLAHISCFGNANGNITVSASSPNTPLRYSMDGGVSFQSTGDFTGLLAGTYTVMVIDDNGCTTSINDLEINEPELLAAQASVLQMPDPGLSNGIAFLDVIDGGVPPYITSLDGQDMGQDTLFQNLSSGTHTITLEDQNQCQLSFEVNLAGEEPELEIPNGFTPNGDGINDTWELTDLNQLYPEAVIQVFNRWGQMIFSSKGYTSPWNGQRNGKDLPTAAYYYVITLSNDIDPLRATVTIIR